MNSSASRFVRYEVIDRVSVITLDRQPVNAYDGAFHVEFQGAWQVARNDPDSRVVLMRATGKHFCVGFPLARAETVIGTRDFIKVIKNPRFRPGSNPTPIAIRIQPWSLPLEFDAA